MFSELRNLIKILQQPGVCLMKERLLDFGKKALYFGLPVYHPPSPSLVAAMGTGAHISGAAANARTM